MGNYFVMSMRFNKCNASDFGFVFKDTNTAVNPKDNSVWVKTNLYDFGWGKENGFYKIPLPCFDELFKLVLYSTDDEDKYGAAAVILERFSYELLCECENLMNNQLRIKDFKKLVEIFSLKVPLNRCSTLGKTYVQIQKEYLRWENISKIAKKL